MTQNETSGSITLTTSSEPTEVVMYHTTTIGDKRRDFRLLVAGPDGSAEIHPVLWGSTRLHPEVSCHGNGC